MNHSVQFTISGSLLALALALPAQAQTVGLLSMVKGDVQIVRAGQTAPVPARTADLLAAGDRVITSAGGEAAFLFCPETRAGKLLAGSEAEFTAAALQVRKGKLGEERKVPNCKLPASLAMTGASGQKAGALRLRGAALVLRTPSRTNVALQQPEFRWDPVENATSYEVKLLNREEQILWKKTLPATELKFPADAPPLEWGQKYWWRVTAFENNENIAEVGSFFQLLPADKSQQVRETEAGLLELSQASPSDNGPLFLLAFLYEDNGMLDSAARVYGRLSASMGQQEWVQGRLNDLMGKLGWDRLESGAAK